MSSSSEELRIPTEMRRLVVTSPGKGTAVKDCTVVVETVPTPSPSSGEVLIKVAAAPVNPSDYERWYSGSSKAGVVSYPLTMGIEGCGVVVATSGAIARFRCPVGTKVGFIIMDKKQGSYSEYVTANVLKGVFLMPSDDDKNIEDCASFFVNPYTACAILDTAKTENPGSNVIVHTAAASQLGQMLNKLAPSEGMEIINVVRREEQAELLRTLGAKHIIVTSTGDDESAWQEDLKTMIRELGATCAFDAVAGTMTGTLLGLMPKRSTVFVYGVLAGHTGNINSLDLIYRKMQVKGLHVTSWIENGGPLWTIPRLYKTGAKVNAGLHNGGWSSSQFYDTTMENAFDDIVALIDGSVTGKKIRIRFDDKKE
jgi:NADPH2:quinone reductase